MDLKESLKQQIDQLASELGVEPGYAKNASETTLQNRLTELENQLDEPGAPDLDPDTDEEEAEQAEQEQSNELGPPAYILTKGERVTSGKQQITATRTFKDGGEWVKAGDTITVTAAKAAEHIRAKRAIRVM